jgi:hypothetical protein
MAKHYTSCIEPSGYTNFNHMLVATFQSLLVGATAAAIALATSARPECWLYVAEVTAAAWLIAYCRLFLYQRLICLGGDRDAIGAVVKVDGSSLPGFPDNDFNVNLLLENNEFGAKRPAVEMSTPFGFLVRAQDKITAAGLPTAGHENKDAVTGTTSETLHCEFEGGGAYVLLVSAEVAFALAVAALILCVYLPPIPFLHKIILALAVLAFLIGLLGGLIGFFGTSGSTSDVNPSLGEIHTNTDPNGGLGRGADILFISGTWVYDPWHVGWNEIHPVKVCTRIGTWEGSWGALPPDVILRLRTQLDLAAADATRLAQHRPENRWVVHPALDGCDTTVIT